MTRVSRKYSLAVLAVLFVLVLTGVLMHQTQRDRSAATLDVMAAQLQSGMTQQEAIRRILSCDRTHIDAVCVRGTTIDNKPMGGLGFSALEAFPPANQVKQAEIEVDDLKGRELVLTLLNGVVTTIRLGDS